MIGARNSGGGTTPSGWYIPSRYWGMSLASSSPAPCRLSPPVRTPRARIDRSRERSSARQGLSHQHPQRQLVVRRPQLGGDLEAEAAEEADVGPAEHRGGGRQAVGVAAQQG